MIMEFRTYRMHPGTRAEFTAFFQSEAIPRMQAVGMTVLGQFSSVTDENVFAYARTFASIEEREQQYRAFYESQDWLGWMIDTAVGKEESFVAFVGDSTPPDGVRGGVSGVHSDRFTLVCSRGTVASVTPAAPGNAAPAGADDGEHHAGLLVVDGDDEVSVEFAVADSARVFSTPDGRGMDPALSISLADITAGDTVLVLGSANPGGLPVARQIVQRPRTTGH